MSSIWTCKYLKTGCLDSSLEDFDFDLSSNCSNSKLYVTIVFYYLLHNYNSNDVLVFVFQLSSWYDGGNYTSSVARYRNQNRTKCSCIITSVLQCGTRIHLITGYDPKCHLATSYCTANYNYAVVV